MFKILVIVFLLGPTSCKQAAQQATQQPIERPPLLERAQAQDVLRILEMTDPLDKIILAGTAGQPFVDLAKEVEIEYLKYRNKLPSNNAMPLDCGASSMNSSASLIITAWRTHSLTERCGIPTRQQGWTIKTMLRKTLLGQATEREWQVFELGDKKAT